MIEIDFYTFKRMYMVTATQYTTPVVRTISGSSALKAGAAAFFSFFLIIFFHNGLLAQLPSTYCDGNPGDWAGFTTNPTHPVVYVRDVANAQDNSDDQFTGGSQDPDVNISSEWFWSLGSANDKGDITNAGAQLINGCILRFFGDRTAINGDAAIGFWFFKSPISKNPNGTFSGTHTNGDILILSHFTNGGGTSSIEVYEWQNGALVPFSLTNVDRCAAVNSTSYTVQAPLAYASKFGNAGTYPTGAFFEGALDLCDLNVSPCFSYFLIETRNSQSLNASLQDFTSGFFDATPPAPSAQGNSRCGPGTVQLTASGCNGTLKWYSVATGGTSLGTGSPFTTPSISQTTDFYVSCTSTQGCEGPRTKVTATINPFPGPPLVNNNERCGEGTLTLTAVGENLKWYSDAGTTTQVGSGNSFTTPTLTPNATTPKVYTYYITATTGAGCISQSAIPVTATIYPLATAEAGDNLSVCVAGTPQPVTLANASVGGGATTGAWSFTPSNAGSLSTLAQTNSPATVTFTPAVGFSGTVTFTLTTNDPTGPCGAVSDTRNLVVTTSNTVTGPGSGTVCIGTALTAITHTTTGATGIGTATGLPTGVSASFANNTITISGTPTVAGTFNYTVPLTGGCGTVNATGTIIVTPNNTVTGPGSATACVNTAITSITHTTTGATGINTSNTGLPSGVTASFANNTITISGTPTVTGTFNYTIPLTGGCGNVNATGTITVTATNTVTGPGSGTVCINTTMTAITHTTTGATGIGSATGLPTGVTAAWANNVITISGTPTVSGTFNYTIPLTGGCGNVSATGTITVTPNNTVNGPFTQTLCVNTPLTPITFATTGATGIGTPTGLPTGVTASFANNTITISGTPTVTGTFNFSIPLTGGCGAVNATGTITVNVCNLEGCTPGYWKNAKADWVCTSGSTNTVISKTTLFFNLFTGVSAQNQLKLGQNGENLTLLQALDLGGGGYNALARHAVAAYLNACNAEVDYPYTTDQIVAAVVDVFTDGETNLGSYTNLDVTELKDVLAAANELGCPLNNSGAVQSVTTRALESGELTLLASPNPYLSNINFNFVSPVSGVANLEIYDLMGRKLAKVFEGQVEKGIPKTIYYRVPSELRVPMIYRLTIGGKTSFGKLLPGSTD